ncbi:hypothetical protein [Lapidilactobacillus luobeiensis]|nr:hypothetical protein [Lapidilactobacillus luobeiensis]
MKVKTKFAAFVPKGSIGTVIEEDKFSYLIEFDGNKKHHAYAKSQVKEVK